MAILKPITRVEQYLASIAGASDVTLPAYPITREEYYLASWAEKSGFEIAEVDGTPPLVLKDCIGEQFKGLVLYGKSTQVTTTGAQLLDIPDAERTIRGVTLRVQNGVIEMNGTATENGYAYMDIAKTQLTGTYTLSIDGAVKGALLDDKFQRLIESTKSLNGETAHMLTFYITKDVKYSLTGIKVMLNAGDTALPWEPYTGGKPSPSPDYPQEIQSAGDDGNLSVIVKNPDNEQMQSVSFSRPNGLPGIPVSSGGNYTDENGQQWICDEVDMERGVYVQRIYTVDVAELEYSAGTILQTVKRIFYKISVPSTGTTNKGYCTRLTYSANYSADNPHFYINEERIVVFIPLDTTIKPKEYLVQYVLATPIETPLSETDIAAYRALTTYKGTTILESECYLKVKYSKLRK